MSMELPLSLNVTKERRVKRAAGLHCELCGGVFPSDLLEIHLLPGGGREAKAGPDLQRELLVLCGRCHRDVHGLMPSRADQKDLVRARPAGARKAIREILCYRPEPYTPPESDLAAVYEEILSGTCLNGSG